MTIVELEATVRLKLPSNQSTVPLVVPFSTTLAPMTGSPVASFTIPETLNLSACRLGSAHIHRRDEAETQQ